MFPKSEHTATERASAGGVDDFAERRGNEVCFEICKALGWPYDNALPEGNNLNQPVGDLSFVPPVPAGDNVGIAAGAHCVDVEITNDKGRRLRIGRRKTIVIGTDDVFGA